MNRISFCFVGLLYPSLVRNGKKLQIANANSRAGAPLKAVILVQELQPLRPVGTEPHRREGLRAEAVGSDENPDLFERASHPMPALIRLSSGLRAGRMAIEEMR